MRRYLKGVLALAVAMAGCDQFVCSQQRIKAIELANHGVEEFKNSLYDSAERDLKLAIQTDPSYEIAHYNLGKVYQKQRKWDKAIEAFEGATERAPNNSNYFYDLGEAYLEAKKMDSAEKALRKATELDPNLFKAHWRLGLVYLTLERPKDADVALRKAIEANPRLDKPFVALGHLYLDYDGIAQAEQVFSECLKANENSAECYNGHGLALKELKKYEPATAEFKKALDLEPGLANAQYNCGMTYAEWYEQSQSPEHKEKARDYLQKFVAGGGGKDGGFGYVKAANDKLYALSGS
jgi:tetratricopeptide (TPR) repeat protein